MPAKYQKFGLRRDKNLSDLENPNAALGNLLDNLGNEPFIPDDLLQAITGLRNTTITVDDLQKTKGTVRVYNDGANEVPFQPLQTIEDNIRNYKVYVGDPPYAGGGDGIEALFVPWAAMEDAFDNTNQYVAGINGDSLFDANYVAPNKNEPGLEGPFDFWDNGIFILPAKMYQSFTDTYGLIQWEGYVRGGQNFDMELTGLLKIEEDKLDNDNWDILKDIYDEDRDITASAATYDGTANITTVTLPAGSSKFICIDDSVDFGGVDTFTVSSFEETGSDCQITVEEDATANGSVSFPTTATFSFGLGADIVRTGTTRISNTATGSVVKIRISLYYPNKGDGRFFPNKRFSDWGEDTDERIPYSNFYTAQPSGEPGIYTYQYFEENRLSKRKKFISPRNSSATTTALETGKLVYANYSPPETHGNRYRGGAEFSYLGNGKFEEVGNVSVSVGDWIAIEFEINNGTRNLGVFTVQDVTTNAETEKLEIYVDVDELTTYINSITGTPTSVCYIHSWKVEGLIGFVSMTSTGTANVFNIANIGGQKLSYSNMSDDIMSDYMISAIGAGMDSSGNIITPASSFTHFKRVTKNSTSSINTSTIYSGDSYTPTSTNGTVWVAGVYSHTGLQDLSTISQCAGTYGVEVTATALSGQSTITVTSTAQISNGDYVQFGNTSGGTNYVSDFIPSGVTVTVLNGTQIQLSQNLNAAIPKNATLVFIKSNPGSSAKEFCVLPLNTAPPFTGTDAGLRTTTTSAPYGDATNFPNLVAEKLIFAEAQFPDVTTLSTVDLTTNPQYGRTLPITYNGTTYKFLIA